MNRALIIFTVLFILNSAANSQPPTHRVYLIGDGGLPVLNANGFKALVKDHADSTITSTFVFLGDNIYPNGLPEKTNLYRKTAERILKEQAEIPEQYNAPGIFVPGNHDWDRGHERGLEHILNQSDFIDSLAIDGVRVLPRKGCPGPEQVELTENAVLFIIDSQWFLHAYEKPGKEDGCTCNSREEFRKILGEALAKHKGKQIILAAHHPVFTYGEHGGVYPLKLHIFPLVELVPWLYIPLPVVGSLYPLLRKLRAHVQDTNHPKNRAYRNMIRLHLENYPGSVYASGHEHTLQHITKSNVHYIVSGSAAKTSPVRKKRHAKYVSDKTGFATLDLFKDGKVELKFYEVNRSSPTYKTFLDIKKK